MKAIAKDVAKYIVEGIDLDMDKMKKKIGDAMESRTDVEAVIAVIHFILKSSVQHQVDHENLTVELQQLGLPHKSCVALVKVYINFKDSAMKTFREASFRLPRLKKVDWRVDYLTDTSDKEEINTPVVQMRWHLTEDSEIATPARLNKDGESDPLVFEVSQEKFDVFYGELRNAYRMMEGVE